MFRSRNENDRKAAKRDLKQEELKKLREEQLKQLDSEMEVYNPKSNKQQQLANLDRYYQSFRNQIEKVMESIRSVESIDPNKELFRECWFEHEKFLDSFDKTYEEFNLGWQMDWPVKKKMEKLQEYYESLEFSLKKAKQLADQQPEDSVYKQISDDISKAFELHKFIENLSGITISSSKRKYQEILVESKEPEPTFTVKKAFSYMLDVLNTNNLKPKGGIFKIPGSTAISQELHDGLNKINYKKILETLKPNFDSVEKQLKDQSAELRQVKLKTLSLEQQIYYAIYKTIDNHQKELQEFSEHPPTKRKEESFALTILQEFNTKLAEIPQAKRDDFYKLPNQVR